MQVDLVQVTTRDGVRLDGMLQLPSTPPQVGLDGVCMIHGTGGNFYSSSLFDAFGARLLERGCAVLRVNTRGHDGVSTAVTTRGGRRLGAAYEVVDDCRHDLTAWLDFLRQRTGPRVGLLGHSLGAVKSIYATAHESALQPTALIAVSPPRLAYSWFCSGPAAAEFLAVYQEAQQYVEQGRPGALLDVKFPLPFVITAAGYVEKYGPDERYAYLPLLRGLRCPVLLTFGALEVANNPAFQDAPAAVAELQAKRANLALEVIDGADHFYSGVRAAVVAAVDRWLERLAPNS